ncbi:cytochrome c oxidase subunit 3 [Rhodococcoides fascians]|uniref:cytochrome c oxidase subunit 3 n=1 Tax=Rhodococcoides fascians TaxID=1828 RepID=UPI00068D0FF8|nr:cytochrome c oxidase subunit 3 [Rhodococcus fascians]
MTSDTNLATARETAHEKGRRIPGEPGLWVFLLGDMIVFGFFFVAFLMERSKEPEEFTASREALGLAIGLTNTMILLVSSLLVVVALNALRLGAHRLASRLYLGAIACGVFFTVLKISEYIHMIGAGHGPEVGPYYMWFFILTGTHLFHVVIGLVALWVMFTRARHRVELTGTQRLVFEGGSCYWHLVDLLWMVLFPLVYLAV